MRILSDDYLIHIGIGMLSISMSGIALILLWHIKKHPHIEILHMKSQQIPRRPDECI